MVGVPFTPEDRVLIVGATGFIGRKLIPELLREKVRLRLLVRDPSRVPPSLAEDTEIAQSDLLQPEGLGDALEGIHTAYYLVHSLRGRSLYKNTEYVELDRKAARNFINESDKAGLKRVIYLGGLGESGSELSEHLRSRGEVGEILSSGKASTTILRAAIIIGAGSASFEMLRYLVERLPVMVCPKWIDTRIQPIAIGDVLAYLAGCLLNPETAGRVFDICGPDILTYAQMIEQYAEVRGLAKRIIFRVPFLTPILSAYWVDLVTPVPSGIAHPLIEGLKTDVVCRDNSIYDLVPVTPTPYREALKSALAEEKEGPGIPGI